MAPLIDLPDHIRIMVGHAMLGLLFLALLLTAVFMIGGLLLIHLPPSFFQFKFQWHRFRSIKKLLCLGITVFLLPELITLVSPLFAFKCSQFFILCLFFFPFLLVD